MPPQPLTTHVLQSLLQRDLPATVKRALHNVLVARSLFGRSIAVSLWSAFLHFGLTTSHRSASPLSHSPFIRCVVSTSFQYLSFPRSFSSRVSSLELSDICSQIILSHPAMAVLFSVPLSQLEYVLSTSAGTGLVTTIVVMTVTEGG